MTRGRFHLPVLDMHYEQSTAPHFHVQTASLSAVDLTIVSPEVIIDFDWEVAGCLHCSEHVSIRISHKSQGSFPAPRRHLIARVD